MEQLAGARELQKRQVTLNALGLRQRDLKLSCRSSLVSLGVVRRRQTRTERDWIEENLVTLYGCKRLSIWHNLLNTEYEHALQILIEAKARFPGAYSEWLGLQDSFNDIVIRQFFEFLKTKGLKGHSKTKEKNGKLVKYGQLIAKDGPFDTAHPATAKAFYTIHARRNRLPGSHPYDEKGGKRNKWLTKKERDFLVPHVRNALDAAATIVEQNK
jgi:hypothetical protein